jgi:hypothetical protein
MGQFVQSMPSRLLHVSPVLTRAQSSCYRLITEAEQIVDPSGLKHTCQALDEQRTCLVGEDMEGATIDDPLEGPAQCFQMERISYLKGHVDRMCASLALSLLDRGRGRNRCPRPHGLVGPGTTHALLCHSQHRVRIPGSCQPAPARRMPVADDQYPRKEYPGTLHRRSGILSVIHTLLFSTGRGEMPVGRDDPAHWLKGW